MTESLYANLFSFLGVPWLRDCPDADVVISGVPFDMATSGRPGTRFGPGGIRAASSNLHWEKPRWPWDFNALDRLKVADFGDVEFSWGEPASLAENLESHADTLLAEGRTLLTFGGDHYVALPLLRAHAKKHGPLALIHFDAHTDTAREGTAFDHGAMFWVAVEEGLVRPENSVQIGIRTHYTREGHPFRVLDAGAVNDRSTEAVLAEVRSIVGDAPAYVSFDIDCLDPAFAPGTGTPVAGGLSTDRALKLVRFLQGLDLRGMDLVEVAPAYDSADITSLAAATLALEFLQVIAAGRG